MPNFKTNMVIISPIRSKLGQPYQYCSAGGMMFYIVAAAVATGDAGKLDAVSGS